MLVHDNLTKLFCLLFALFQFAAHVQGSATGPAKKRAAQSSVDEGSLLTNAARMAAGLPPLKPRSLLIPSRRVTARSPTSSVVPIGGTIQVVKKSNGSPVGYVSKNVGLLGYGITNNPSDMMSVTFMPVAPFNMVIVSPSAFPYLGFSGDDLENDHANPLVATNPTSPGSSPKSVGNTISNTNSESSIWSYDFTTHELTAQWVNHNPGLPKTHFWYYPLLNELAIVRIPALQDNGYEVILNLITS